MALRWALSFYTMAITTNYPVLQATDAFVVTPNNSADLSADAGNTKGWTLAALFVGTAGDINVDTAEGTTVLFKNISNGTFLPIIVKRVRVTNTTATNIVALAAK